MFEASKCEDKIRVGQGRGKAEREGEQIVCMKTINTTE